MCSSRRRSSHRRPSSGAHAAGACRPMPASASSAASIRPSRSARCERATELLLAIAGGAGRAGQRRRSRDEHLPQRRAGASAPQAVGAAARRSATGRRASSATPRARCRCRCQRTRGRLARHAAAASLRHRHRGGSHRGSRAHRRVSRPFPRRTRWCRSVSAALPEERAAEQRRARDAGRRAAIRRRSPTPSSIRRCSRGCSPSAPGSRWPIRSRAICPSCACRCGRACCKAALENQRRQQDRIRLFEHGARFVPDAEAAGATARDRHAGRHRLGPAAARAVGCRGHARAGGFLRREGGSRGAARRHRRAVRRIHFRAARRLLVSASRAGRRECCARASASRLARGAASRRWCRRWSLHMPRCSSSSTIEAALARQSGRTITRFPAFRRCAAIWRWWWMNPWL